MIAKPIEPRLAKRDDARLADKRHDAIPILRLGFGRVVRMNADCRVDRLILRRQPHHRGARFSGHRDRDHPLDPRRLRPRDHLRAIGVEVVRIKMGVRINESHGKPNLRIL